MNVRKFAIVLVLLCSALLSMCTNEKTASAPVKETPLRAVDPATRANISGVVKFTGAAPKPIPIDMSADPACRGQNAAEPIAVKNGNLANVFVYVKDGLGDSGWTYSAPQVEIVQQGCKYSPHVVGIMVGQTVRIVNADDTMHNIHPMPQHNHEWNAAQMAHGEPLVKKFDNPELMIPVKCNQHPWMKMYVNVASSPFFAVTGTDGKFNIDGLPPGTYTIAVVHETLGEQTQKLVLGPRESKEVSFIFATQNSAAAAK